MLLEASATECRLKLPRHNSMLNVGQVSASSLYFITWNPAVIQTAHLQVGHLKATLCTQTLNTLHSPKLCTQTLNTLHSLASRAPQGYTLHVEPLFGGLRLLGVQLCWTLWRVLGSVGHNKEHREINLQLLSLTLKTLQGKSCVYATTRAITFGQVHTHYYTYMCMHVEFRTHAHTHSHVHTHKCAHTTHTNMHAHTFICTHTHACMHAHTYTHTYKHTHIRTHTCTHTHTHTHTHAHTHAHVPGPCPPNGPARTDCWTASTQAAGCGGVGPHCLGPAALHTPIPAGPVHAHAA